MGEDKEGCKLVCHLSFPTLAAAGEQLTLVEAVAKRTSTAVVSRSPRMHLCPSKSGPFPPLPVLPADVAHDAWRAFGTPLPPMLEPLGGALPGAVLVSTSGCPLGMSSCASVQ